MIIVREHDELWTDNETGELITATEAIHRHYTINKFDYLSDWTKYYTFTGQYSETLIEYPDFTKATRR